MSTLVSLEEAKAHLRIDLDTMDQDISLKLEAAEARIMYHCQGLEWGKLEGAQVALAKAAILNLVGYLDRIRAGEEGDDLNYLPPSVHSLLLPLRTPMVG